MKIAFGLLPVVSTVAAQNVNDTPKHTWPRQRPRPVGAKASRSSDDGKQ